MNKTLATTYTYIIFLGWLAAPAQTQEPISKSQDDTNARLQKIEATMDALSKQVSDLKLMLEGTSALLRAQANAKEIAALKEEVDKLRSAYQADVGRLNAELAKLQAADTTRRAFSPPTTPPQGTIQLYNDWYLPVTVIIDAFAYRLEPGERRSVSKPVGPFSYEVVGVQAPVIRTLTADRGFVIRIAP